MISQILVATDGSENAERAVRFSAQLAECSHQTIITVVSVHVLVPPVAPVGIGPLESVGPLEDMQAYTLEKEVDAQERKEAQQVVDHAVKEIQGLINSPEVIVSGRVVVATSAVDGILQVAKEISADIIVVGTHGRNALEQVILGSVSHSLIQKADCPILVVK